MNCPHCGAHIPALNLKPNCSNCGVNIIYYTQEYGLIKDAKRAELEFASARIVVAKVRASFIGGALQIARLVMIFACAAVFLLPFATLNYALPLRNVELSVSGLGLYSMYSDGILMKIPDFLSSTLYGGDTVKLLIVLASFLLAFITAVVLLVWYILSFLNIAKTAKSMAVVSFVSAVFCLAGGIIPFALKSSLSALVTMKPGFGAFVACAVFIANAIINIKISKLDITLKVRENDFARKEMLKKVKSGEVDLDDLPVPVFETEEEKAERIKALEEALRKEEEGKE